MKIGRNDACLCGSKMKFKQCCGSASRECGDCNLCCTAFQLDFLDKPKGVECPLYNKCVGCMVHNTPQQHDICRNYRCAWKLAKTVVPKPNRCGFLISVNYSRYKSILLLNVVTNQPLCDESFEQISEWFEKNNPHLFSYAIYSRMEYGKIRLRTKALSKEDAIVALDGLSEVQSEIVSQQYAKSA